MQEKNMPVTQERRKNEMVFNNGVKHSVCPQTFPLLLAFAQGMNAFALCPGCWFRGEKAKLHIFCKEEL